MLIKYTSLKTWAKEVKYSHEISVILYWFLISLSFLSQADGAVLVMMAADWRPLNGISLIVVFSSGSMLSISVASADGWGWGVCSI